MVPHYQMAAVELQLILVHKLRGELVTRDDPQGRPTIFQRLATMGVLRHDASLRGGGRRRGTAATTSPFSEYKPAPSPPAEGGTSNFGTAPTLSTATGSVRHLMPIGRLDFNSEGLLLLTNDGALASYMTSPAARIERVYHVRVYGRLADNAIKALRRGANVDGVHYAPARVRLLSEPEPGAAGADPRANSWLELTLHEGKVSVLSRSHLPRGRVKSEAGVCTLY